MILKKVCSLLIKVKGLALERKEHRHGKKMRR